MEIESMKYKKCIYIYPRIISFRANETLLNLVLFHWYDF